MASTAPNDYLVTLLDTEFPRFVPSRVGRQRHRRLVGLDREQLLARGDHITGLDMDRDDDARLDPLAQIRAT